MKRRMLLLGLGLLLGAMTGCGGDERAPVDAVVTGPEDAEAVEIQPPGGGRIYYRNLRFHVKNQNGDAIPGVEIEFLANGFQTGAILTDRNGNVLNTDNPDFYETTTDESGVAHVTLQVDLPPSDPTQTIKATASVEANVGAAHDTWKAAITINPVATPTPTPTP